MLEQIPGTYPQKLTRAGGYLANLLEENGKPVLTQFNFFQIVWRMYRESSDKKLYLRHDTPSQDDYARLRLPLHRLKAVDSTCD